MLFMTLPLVFFGLLASAAPSNHVPDLQSRQSSDKLVFCHFMMGVIANRGSPSDYDGDMSAAKAAGIDAFALNIGTDTYTDQQLGYAYDSAAKNGMSVFLSFDFNWWQTSQASEVGAKIAQFASKTAQLKVDGKVFVSSFLGDGLDLGAVQAASKMSLFWAPNFQPNNVGSADALLNWMAWPNNGNNKAPSGGVNLTVEQGDTSYVNALHGKPYIAPVSAWFSTHYGLEVSYSKNWVFPSNLLWYDRWTSIISQPSPPQYIEILTWNDYGESHYIGPLSSPHSDDGNSKWTNDMPHDGWLEMAKPYIAAFKAGQQTISVTEDQLIYWYRPATKTASCDSTDTCNKAWPSSSPNPNYFVGRPNGADTMEDLVFVVALLTDAGTVTVSSGGNTQQFPAKKGPNAFTLALGTGKQSFSLTRSGQTVLSGDSLRDVSSSCVCGIYNFNAYVGTLPAGPADTLSSAGLAKFAVGLQATCQATPSLGTAPTGNGGSGTSAATQTALSSGSASSALLPSSTDIASASPFSNTMTTPLPASMSQSYASSALPASTSSTFAGAPGSGGACVMTSLGQFGPKNCLPKDCTWQGPVGSTTPSPCDGS